MTFEFKAAVSSDGQITLPPDIAGQIPAGKELHIVLTWEAPVDSASYRALGQKLQEASSGALAEETVYDSLA
jgi:hypothetical protein